MRASALRPRLRGAVAVLLAALLVYLYLPTFLWLGQQWLGGGFFADEARDWSHGPLVVLLMGYLLWRRRRELSPEGTSLWGLPLLLVGVGLHLAGVSLGAPYLSAYSLIPVSLGMACLFRGSRAGRRLIVPFLLFLLAVPFPADEWGVTGALARVVAIASAFLSRLAGAAVLRSGQLITVGQDEYVVELLCSGFNFIMALLALVVPLLYLREASLKHLGLALIWVPALGLATKVLLISTLLVLTPRLGQESTLNLYHGWLGISFYLGALGVAFVIATFWLRVARQPSLLGHPLRPLARGG